MTHSLYASWQSFWHNKHRLVSLFILANFAFLVLDIWIAHYINQFAHAAEWLPFYFSIFASLSLSVTLFSKKLGTNLRYYIQLVIAYASILLGIAGMYFHLESQFFTNLTLKSLVYTAPFVAPLSYSGLGFLLLLNNSDMQQKDAKRWAQWLIFLAYAAFGAIFILAICDHAQNDFFHITEWIPVGASALALGFLSMPVMFEAFPAILRYCRYIMYGMAFTGLLGFLLHFISLMQNFGSHFFPNFVYGAPLLAPLLFTNVAFLAILGLDVLESLCSEPS